MIRLVDIKQSIINLLRVQYSKIKIYFDNIDKAEMPYFYVQFSAVKNTSLDEFYTDKLIQIDVTYCPEQRRICKRNDLYMMADEIDQLFRPVFHVLDRYLTLQDAESKIHDDVLHYIFNLDFTDVLEPKEMHELMQTLEMEWE